MTNRRREQERQPSTGDAQVYFSAEQALRQLSDPTVAQVEAPTPQYLSLLLGERARLLELLAEGDPVEMVNFFAALAQIIASLPRQKFKGENHILPPHGLDELMKTLNLVPADFSIQPIPYNPTEPKREGRITPTQRAALLRLTQREWLILKLVGVGESRERIAKVVGLGTNHLNTVIRAIPHKLAVPDITAAAVLYARSGLKS